MGSTLEATNILLIYIELRASNYTVLRDYAGKNRAEWIKYRAALRDLPNDPNWPDVVFPERPSEPPLKLNEIENIEIEEIKEDES